MSFACRQSQHDEVRGERLEQKSLNFNSTIDFILVYALLRMVVVMNCKSKTKVMHNLTRSNPRIANERMSKKKLNNN